MRAWLSRYTRYSLWEKLLPEYLGIWMGVPCGTTTSQPSSLIFTSNLGSAGTTERLVKQLQQFLLLTTIGLKGGAKYMHTLLSDSLMTKLISMNSITSILTFSQHNILSLHYSVQYQCSPVLLCTQYIQIYSTYTWFSSPLGYNGVIPHGWGCEGPVV